MCRSDADADVLADYVLALLKHDGSAQDVRRLCNEEIPDFLKEGESSCGGGAERADLLWGKGDMGEH